MEASYGKTYSQLIIQHLEPGNIIGEISGWINPQTFLLIQEGGYAAAAPIYQRLCDQEISYVVKWHQVEYFSSFYEKMTFHEGRKSLLSVLNWKLKVHRQFLPAGKTSQNIDTWILDQETDDPIMVMSAVVVRIDPIMHHPIPLGPLYKKQFTQENCQFNTRRYKMDPSNQKLLKMPVDVAAFTSTSYVNVRQIDDNNHVNQSEYFNFCFDCISEAFYKSFFGDLGSIFYHNLRRMTFLHVKESLFGERIDTTCWQVNQNPLIFVFHCKNQKGIVCQTEFEFFPEPLDKPKL